MRYLLVIFAILAGCAMVIEPDPPTDEEPVCNYGEEYPCCSWSDLYIGVCVEDHLVGCGTCLELDGEPGLGPWTW